MFDVCSTILEEEKLQQEERLRMEMRRQVTVSWDSGGSDEAPPKVRLHCLTVLLRHFSLIIFLCSSTRVCYGWLKKKKQPVFLSACSPVDQVTPVLVPAKASSPARNSTTSRYSKHTPRIHTNKHTHTENKHKHTTARKFLFIHRGCSSVLLRLSRGLRWQQQLSAAVDKDYYYCYW